MSKCSLLLLDTSNESIPLHFWYRKCFRSDRREHTSSEQGIQVEQTAIGNSPLPIAYWKLSIRVRHSESEFLTLLWPAKWPGSDLDETWNPKQILSRQACLIISSDYRADMQIVRLHYKIRFDQNIDAANRNFPFTWWVSGLFLLGLFDRPY